MKILKIKKALSSQLEIILDNEAQQRITDNSNEEGGGANLWNGDETYEDYYNEGRHTYIK